MRLDTEQKWQLGGLVFLLIAFVSVVAAQSSGISGRSISSSNSTTCDVGGPGSFVTCLTSDKRLLVSVDGSDLADPVNFAQPQQQVTLTIGVVSTLAPGSLATATITGTSPNFVLNLGIPQGTQGLQGATGLQGAKGDTGPPPPTGTTFKVTVE